jgi:signal transduction histidine kinase
MKVRTARFLAWAGVAISAAEVVGAFAIGAAGNASSNEFAAVGLVLVLTFPLMGALIASKRPESPIGWIFIAVGLSFSTASLTGQWSDYALVQRPGALPFGAFMSWVAVWAWPPGILLVFTFLLLLFPDGQLPSRRWRVVVRLALADLALLVVPVAITAWPIRGPVLLNIGDSAPEAASDAFKLGYNLQVAGILVMFVLGLFSAASLIVRMRRATGDEREQIKWFAFAASILVVAVILGSPLFHVGGQLQVVAFPLVPLASAIAILKYRLYDIDVVINKTVVVGALAAFVTIVYLAIVVGVGAAIGTHGEPNVVLSIVATAIVAIAFQPLRTRAQRLANRLVYGKRATPYEVLSIFAERMGETFSTEDVLPRLARAIADGTGATKAEVWLRVGDRLRLAASWPAVATENVWLPLDDREPVDVAGADRVAEVRHQSELLGALTLTKPANDPVTPGEEKLLTDLASQAGLVLRNVRLTAELRARLEDLRSSRQRLVAAQDEERRKLERNLHDGAQQQLVALAVKARLASGLIGKEPEKELTMLNDLQQGLGDALETLRDLARGIYPPLLADKGLGAALEAQARKAAMPVAVEPNGIGRYPQEIEAAVYFCTLEALNNVAKYAEASSVQVSLAEERGELRIQIVDDGRGFDTSVTDYGTGLQGMADRLDAVGGRLEVRSKPGRGTTIIGRVPTGS